MDNCKLRIIFFLAGIILFSTNFVTFSVRFNYIRSYFPFLWNSTEAFRVNEKEVSGSQVREIKDLGFKFASKIPLANISLNLTCQYWAVVTTVFSPSVAVRRIANHPIWCLVIVADKRTPSETEYLKRLEMPINKTIVFLTTADQDRLFPFLSEVIPWNQFSRKNIGYMFAIKHGAAIIWDFDDDNINVLPLELLRTDNYKIACKDVEYKLYNPYPHFNDNESYTWPRGFPLEHIRNPLTVPKLCNSTIKRQIAVIQSLANIQPDVDAIYRLTRDTPFSFQATPLSHLPVMVSLLSYSPFNAQATLWARDAFRYLALPTSVSGRVSDIWRSYIAQYFFHKQSLHVLFVPPYIDQIRNPHNYMQDFREESDLYLKSNELINFLSSDDVNVSELSELYMDMYKSGYLGKSDILFIQAWIQTFEKILEPH